MSFSCSYDELVNRSRDQSVSDYSKFLLISLSMHIRMSIVLTNFGISVVMFFRFVTAGEIRTRAEFFEPFITGLSNATVDQVCTYTYHALDSSHLVYESVKRTNSCGISVDLKSFSNKNLLV